MTESHGVSIKRACEVARLPRATFYKPGRRCARGDLEVIGVLNGIVATECRWGFWKCFERLRQMGHRWNHKRVHRVYCALGLNRFPLFTALAVLENRRNVRRSLC